MIRLGTNPLLKAGQENPVGGKGTQEWTESEALPLLRVPQETPS